MTVAVLERQLDRSPPASACAVRLAHVSKRFPKRRGLWEALTHRRAGEFAHAMRDVSCDIWQGEFFGVLGPNGAGKTTLFKILSTMVLPDDGSARIHGLDVQRDAREVRSIVAPVVTDERGLYWRLSAIENLKLFAALYGVARGDTRDRITDALDRVGLAHTGQQLVATFSSGMRQRLLIARALLVRPRVLLLDEPTRSLDPVSARELRRFLREEIAGRDGCTVILATHNAEEAFQLCDRVAVFDRGRLLAVGPAEALANRAGREAHAAWMHTRVALLRDVLEDAKALGVVSNARLVESTPDEWSYVEFDVHGGLRGAADALAFFSTAGVDVARFERRIASLADLLVQVIARTPETVDDA